MSIFWLLPKIFLGTEKLIENDKSLSQGFRKLSYLTVPLMVLWFTLITDCSFKPQNHDHTSLNKSMESWLDQLDRWLPDTSRKNANTHLIEPSL